MKKIKEYFVWIMVYVLAVAIGAGIAVFVIEAIEMTKVKACFDYKNPDVCEEIVNKAREYYEKN